MKDLLIDIGNTRGKMALVSHGVIQEQSLFSEELFLAWVDSHNIQRVVACIVGKGPDFDSLLTSFPALRFHRLTAASKLPICLDYDTPETLGADRIAAVVGAQRLYPNTPLLVVDAGSCITLDYLDVDGRYHGGAILPGISMKFKALHTFTEKLPLLTDNGNEAPLVGKTTADAIRSGVLNGTYYALEGYLSRYQQLNPNVKLLFTGGDADSLLPRFPGAECCHDLVWQGLLAVMNTNL